MNRTMPSRGASLLKRLHIDFLHIKFFHDELSRVLKEIDLLLRINFIATEHRRCQMEIKANVLLIIFFYRPIGSNFLILKFLEILQ